MIRSNPLFNFLLFFAAHTAGGAAVRLKKVIEFEQVVS